MKKQLSSFYSRRSIACKNLKRLHRNCNKKEKLRKYLQLYSALKTMTTKIRKRSNNPKLGEILI